MAGCWPAERVVKLTTTVVEKERVSLAKEEREKRRKRDRDTVAKADAAAAAQICTVACKGLGNPAQNSCYCE